MNLDNKTYKKFANATAGKSPLLCDCVKAFLFGGLICSIGQALYDVYTLALGIGEEIAKPLVPITLIFIAGLLTGIGVFDNIAKHAGAGTLVPITGFANAVIAPAIDNKSEGFILGVGAKMFIIAGPVIVFGVLSSVIYGIFYYIFGR